MASIQTRTNSAGDTVWRVMYRINGSQASDSFHEPAAANRYKRLVELIGGQAARDSLNAHTISDGAPTLAAYFDHYLAHLTGAEDGTVAEYRRLAKRTWLPTLGHLPIDTISSDAVKTWVGVQARTITKRGTPTSAKTIANAHGLLSQTFAAAIEAEHCLRNPAKKVPLPTGLREEMVFLSHAEFARLLHAVPVYWQPLVATLAGTGMRWGEATALRWGDVDLDAPTPILVVTRAWKRGPTTRKLGAPKSGRSRRRISLSPEVVAILRPLRGPADQLVFRGPRGGTVHHQAFHPRVWQPALVKANLGKMPRIHDLRHTHASWLLADNVPPNVVQNRLGHKSIKTTVDTYGHLMGNAQDVAAMATSRALSSAMPAIEG